MAIAKTPKASKPKKPKKSTLADATPVPVPAAAPAAAPDGSFVADGPRYVDGVMYLSKADLLSLENAHLQVEKHLQAIGLKQGEIYQLRNQYAETIRQKEADIVAIKSLCKGREEEYKAIQRQIESVYGVDLTKVTYDDKTGRIHNVE